MSFLREQFICNYFWTSVDAFYEESVLMLKVLFDYKFSGHIFYEFCKTFVNGCCLVYSSNFVNLLETAADWVGADWMTANWMATDFC